MSLKENLAYEEEQLKPRRVFSLIDYEQLFANTPQAKIVNNDALVSKKMSKEYTEAILNNSDGDLGFIPTCKCGEVRGVSKIDSYCALCDSVCSDQFIDKLTHTTWLGIPNSMPPVLHPIWYQILSSWTAIRRKKLSIVDVILNPEEDVPEEYIPYIKGRGFQYFHDNIDEILDILMYQCPITAKKPLAKWIGPFREKYRHVMFTRKLPILHNSLHPLKSNGGTLKYADRTSKEILEAVSDLSVETFKCHSTTVSPKQFNRTLWEIYQKVITYYNSLEMEKLAGKPAILRKHCCGTRLHFSFRAVIVPHSSVMGMDEVILPWGIMLGVMRYIILNFLMNRKDKSFAEAYLQYMNARTTFDQEVADCMMEHIQESGGYINIAFGRNPMKYGRPLGN